MNNMPLIDIGHQKGQVFDIYSDLVKMIQTHRYASNAKLPNERVLANQFDVTRNTIRNVFSMLQNQGLIERRVGDGTYVRHHSLTELITTPAKTSSPRSIPSFLEILEGRLLFEPEIVGLASERAQDVNFVAMRNHIQHMRSASNWSDFKEHLYALHLEIYKSTQNRFWIQLFEGIVADRRALDNENVNLRNTPLSETVRDQTVNELESLLKAILERNRQLSTQLSRESLLRTISSMAFYG